MIVCDRREVKCHVLTGQNLGDIVHFGQIRGKRDSIDRGYVVVSATRRVVSAQKVAGRVPREREDAERALKTPHASVKSRIGVIFNLNQDRKPNICFSLTGYC